MASINTTEAPDPAAGSVTAGADIGTPETAGAGITAAGCDSPLRWRSRGP